MQVWTIARDYMWPEEQREFSSSDKWVKIGGLLAALGLGGTTIAKEVVGRANTADFAGYIIAMQNYFLTNCQALENNSSRIVCSGPQPQAPSIDQGPGGNILTGFSVAFEVIIILLLGWTLISSLKSERANEDSDHGQLLLNSSLSDDLSFIQSNEESKLMRRVDDPGLTQSSAL